MIPFALDAHFGVHHPAARRIRRVLATPPLSQVGTILGPILGLDGIGPHAKGTIVDGEHRVGRRALGIQYHKTLRGHRHQRSSRADLEGHHLVLFQGLAELVGDVRFERDFVGSASLRAPLNPQATAEKRDLGSRNLWLDAHQRIIKGLGVQRVAKAHQPGRHGRAFLTPATTGLDHLQWAIGGKGVALHRLGGARSLHRWRAGTDVHRDRRVVGQPFAGPEG